MRVGLFLRSLIGALPFLLSPVVTPIGRPPGLYSRAVLAGLMALLFLMLLLPFEDRGVFPRFLTRLVIVGLTALSTVGVLVSSFGRPPSLTGVAGAAAAGYGLLYVYDRLDSLAPFEGSSTPRPKQVLVVGAGEAGRMLVREIRTHAGLNREVVGFVDDDPDKQSGAGVGGIPVLGGTDHVAEFCRRLDVDEVIIAMPSVDGTVIRSVTRQAHRLNASLRIVPGIREIIEGDFRWNQIRNVRPEDLLGRETVRVDEERIQGFLRGKTVLVTGAAGSIGSHLVQSLVRHPVAAVVGLDFNESGLYELEASELTANQQDTFESVLGDVRDTSLVRDVMERHRPEVILHAAALKHVPMVEHHPREALRTNLAGCLNVFRAARRTDVDHCLFVSTDKAVEPRNIMGYTKRVGEKLVATFQAENVGTRFAAVRFGNVIGSRGSVVPLFKRQIEKGGPVTVTSPDAVRYFMTPGEAVRLVLMATSLEDRGGLYVLDLGDPVSILDLARQLITLAGYEPDTEIPITITGLREGEKTEEKLIGENEAPDATIHSKIQLVRPSPLTGEQFDRLETVLEDPPDDPSDVRAFLRELSR